MAMSAKRRHWKSVGVVVLVMWAMLMTTCVGCQVVANHAYRGMEPRGIITLGDYLARWPKSECFAMVDARGREYVVAYGETPFFLDLVMLPSGPPAYVFDGNGRILAWSLDIGDDPKFDTKWNAQRGRSVGRRLSREELAEWAGRDAGW